MSVTEQNLAGPDLKHLDGKTFDAVLVWLEQALRGHEPLPRVVPGESPEDSILRQERTLMTITREDLREACRRLVRRFVRQPVDKDEFVAALLRLAKGFALVEVPDDLHALAAAEERFSSLPAAQQRTLLSTLLDMRAPLPASFWYQLAGRDPERFGVVSFSGLLRQTLPGALQILPLLPDDEGIADAVYVVLSQHAQRLEDAERDEMVTRIRAEAGNCKPCIQSAVKEWADEQPPVRRQEAVLRDVSGLGRALMAWAAHRHETYKPVSRAARLVPSQKEEPRAA